MFAASIRVQAQPYQAGPHGPSQHEGQGHHQGAGLQLPDGTGKRILWQSLLFRTLTKHT